MNAPGTLSTVLPACLHPPVVVNIPLKHYFDSNRSNPTLMDRMINVHFLLQSMFSYSYPYCWLYHCSSGDTHIIMVGHHQVLSSDECHLPIIFFYCCTAADGDRQLVSSITHSSPLDSPSGARRRAFLVDLLRWFTKDRCIEKLDYRVNFFQWNFFYCWPSSSQRIYKLMCAWYITFVSNKLRESTVVTTTKTKTLWRWSDAQHIISTLVSGGW